MKQLDLHTTCKIHKLVIDYLNGLDKGFLIESSLVNKVCKISWISKEGKDGLYVYKIDSNELADEKRYFHEGHEFPGKYELIIDIPNNCIDFYYYPSLFAASDHAFGYESNPINEKMLRVRGCGQLESNKRKLNPYDIESFDDLDRLYYLLEYIDNWNKKRNNILKLEYLLESRPNSGGMNYRRWFLHKTFDLSNFDFSNNDETTDSISDVITDNTLDEIIDCIFSSSNIGDFMNEFKKVIEYLLNNPLLIKEIVCLSLKDFWDGNTYEKIINGELTEIIKNSLKED